MSPELLVNASPAMAPVDAFVLVTPTRTDPELDLDTVKSPAVEKLAIVVAFI